jgi:hypothetical protein
MKSVTATPDWVSLLSPLLEATEIRDTNGQVLGVYTPRTEADGGRREAMFDLEEAERTLQREHDRGRPLVDIWRDIRGTK